jgi:sulfide:quinone oxidoreductase
MSKPAANIVIVGGGTGGTLTANLLAKHLAKEIRHGEVNVYLVSSSSKHVFQPGNLDVAFRGEDPGKFVRTERELVNDHVQYIEDRVDLISLTSKKVLLKSQKELAYDYLVLATGSVANPGAIPGLKEASLNFHTSGDESRKVWDALEQFDGGHVVVGIAGVPHKCPPSPDEAVFLLDDRLRERGVRDKAKITFLTPYPRSYPAEPMSKVVEPRLKERDIELVTFFNVDSVDPVKKELYSLEGETASYDLLIMVPPHRGADVIIKSGIGDKDGWIPTDKNTLKVKGQENVYAIGDATDIPVSKTGVTAHLEAMVAAHNIISSIRGECELHKYTGRINCPFEMGAGKAAFVIGTYDTPVKQVQPTRIKYAMKRGFEHFYWRTLSGNWDWLLNLYFGKTDIVEEVSKVESAA